MVEEFTAAASSDGRLECLDWVLFHQALFEIHQLAVIAEEILKPPIPADWISRIQAVVSGHPLPQLESDRTHARNIQFELYVAACCRRAGYVIEPKEPDILVHAQSGNFGIAAKRPKSAKSLERHIRKGSRQIQESTAEGILALDLTVIHNPKNQIQVISTKENATETVQRVADLFVERNRRRICCMVTQPNIFGLLVCMSGLFFIRTTLQFAQATRWTFTNLCDQSHTRYWQLRDMAIKFAE